MSSSNEELIYWLDRQSHILERIATALERLAGVREMSMVLTPHPGWWTEPCPHCGCRLRLEQSCPGCGADRECYKATNQHETEQLDEVTS